MLVAVDLDGTADSFPREMQSVMSALRVAGHRVVVLTGSALPIVEMREVEAKAVYLASLGLGECYDQLVVVAGPESEVPRNKALWLREKGAAVLIDNSTANAAAASAVGVLALVPWNSRTD